MLIGIRLWINKENGFSNQRPKANVINILQMTDKINYYVHYINTNVHFAGFHASLFRWAKMFYSIDTKGLYHKTFYGRNL